MTAPALIAHLAAAGVRLWRHGDNLRWRGPLGSVGWDELAAMHAAKADILAELDAAAADRFEETAAFLEFEQGLRREQAEALARGEMST